jgi:hypothetical protein
MQPPSPLIPEDRRLMQSCLCDCCGYKKVRLIERRLNMLLMTTLNWIIIIGLPLLVAAYIVGTKVKDKYY